MNYNTQVSLANLRFLIYLLLMLSGFLFSCSSPQKKDGGNFEQSGLETKKTSQIIVNDSTFLALFPEISDEKLHVFSPNERTGGNKFAGTKIPQEFDPYFSFDRYFKRDSGDIYTNIYSCYQIKLSDNRIGLIVRAPGMYYETAMDLLIWDEVQDSVIGHINLANESVDADWYFVKDSWLTDLNGDLKPDIVTRRKDQWIEDVDKGYGKLHITDSIKVSIAAKSDFKTSHLKIDTNNHKLFDWPKIN